MLPAGASAYVARSPAGFRARALSPRRGEGLLVVGAPGGWFDTAAGAQGAWALRDAAGADIAQS